MAQSCTHVPSLGVMHVVQPAIFLAQEPFSCCTKYAAYVSISPLKSVKRCWMMPLSHTCHTAHKQGGRESSDVLP